MKYIFLVYGFCFVLFSFSACVKPERSEMAVFTPQPTESGEMQSSTEDENAAFVERADETTEVNTIEIDTTEEAEANAMKERFGENCIAEQTFEVELSEYSGKVWFVSFAPSEEEPDFHIQIIQDDEILNEIHAYVPEELEEEEFSSLDAVSFYDVNYDGNTDIVLIETYGDTTFAAVYYAEEYSDWYAFYAQRQLSENISSQIEQLSISEIRNFLTDGKKNGEFADYQEAYMTISRLRELEGMGELQYNLIYFDEDDIPELVAGHAGYFVSLYTYHDGSVYALMNDWAYGAGGNTGYDYCPRKNSLRNYNADFAGLVVTTTYMTISERYTMDIVRQIETLFFDDANGDGGPNEGEAENDYGVSYIDGIEVSEEECASYDVGEYEPIEPAMSLDALKLKLNGA